MPTAYLASFENELDCAAMAAKTAIDAIPEDISIENKAEMIDSASASAFVAAERIIVRKPRRRGDAAIRAKATAWLDGSYWSVARA